MEMKADDEVMTGTKMQMGMLDEEAAMVDEPREAVIILDKSEQWYNPTATSRAAASPMLYERVKTACIEKVGMKENVNTSPLSQLVLPNVPRDFDAQNESEGLVEITMEIVEKDLKTQRILNTWTIMVDADPANPSKTNPQPPHFGYQVSLHKTGSSAFKFTGHIWLPNNDPPPHVRPGHTVTSFSGTQRKGADTSMIFFYMTGNRHYDLL